MSVPPPQRFDIRTPGYREAALAWFRQNGSVILTHVVPDGSEEDTLAWKERATEVPSLLFDSHPDLLLTKHQAAGVHVEHDGASGLRGRALPPHTDGYVWGDQYPDVVILLCEQQASLMEGEGGGGENYLVDGTRFVGKKKEKDHEQSSNNNNHKEGLLEPAVVELLSKVPVDHTERKDSGFVEEGAVSIVPVFQWKPCPPSSWWSRSAGQQDTEEATTQKRFMWRRMVNFDYVMGTKIMDESTYISAWKVPSNHHEDTDADNSTTTTTDPKAIQNALQKVDQAIYRESSCDTVTPRFRLQRGEALLVDNFRMLHARQAYQDSSTNDSRRMWRVWSWTTESNGLPPNVKDAHVPPTVMEAEKAIVSQ